MLRSLNSGVSAMQQFQLRMDVIGNNIANVNTAGFKGARVDFSDTLSQTLRGAGPGGSMQIGTGVTTASIMNQFTQGSISATGVQTDLAIAGNGFFIVENNATGAQYATRAGDFRLDANGFMVTTGGLRVQGYTDAGLTTMGDVQIDTTGAPATATPGASISSFSIDADGKINVRLSDGTEFVRGQVLLQQFNSPQSLVKEGSNLYSGLNAAGPMAAMAAPNTAGLGQIAGASLESSNVDLANEFANMITTQRAFQASARVITTSDEILNELVNLKR